MSEELKGCPFCGEAPEVDDIDYAQCINEDCLMYWISIHLSQWQAPRPVEDGLREERDRLLKALFEAKDKATELVGYIDGLI